MRTVTTEDNPYKVAGIYFLRLKCESILEVLIYMIFCPEKEDAICSRFHLENEVITGDIAVYQNFQNGAGS